MWNVLYLIPTAFFNEKSDHDVKLAKPIVNFIHFWSNKYNHPEEYVMCKENSSDLILPKLCIFFARKRSFFIYLFIYLFTYLWWGEGGNCPSVPLARAPMKICHFYTNTTKYGTVKVVFLAALSIFHCAVGCPTWWQKRTLLNLHFGLLSSALSKFIQ